MHQMPSVSSSSGRLHGNVELHTKLARMGGYNDWLRVVK